MAAFPDSPRPDDAEFWLEANTQVFTSPLDKTTQTLELDGALWRARLTFSRLDKTDRAALASFGVALMGQSGRFTLWDHMAETPRGTYDAGLDTPLVKGGGQTGGALVTDGWRANITGIMLAGDYFQVTIAGVPSLHMATAQVDTDATASATILFKPPLRGSPADDAALTLVKASAQFRLVGDDQPRWLSRTSLATIALDCIEAP